MTHAPHLYPATQSSLPVSTSPARRYPRTRGSKTPSGTCLRLQTRERRGVVGCRETSSGKRDVSLAPNSTPPPARSPATPGHPLALMPSWPVSEQRGSQSSPDESTDPWLLILAPAPSPPGPLTPPLGGPDFFLLRLSRFTRAEDPRARGQVQGRSRVWRSGRLRTRPAPGQDAEPRRAARVRAGAEARAAAPPAPQPPASAPRRP